MKENEYQMVSNGISIKVVPQYEEQHSKPSIGKFTFSYKVTIENMSNKPVKLVSRHWFIHDSIQIRREVSGEGVVGQQPVLKPGEVFVYSSWCPLQSSLGKMYGNYNFITLDEEKRKFEAAIPEFILAATFILN
ncbi:MAG: Co2+/Mg2+ efflux protein ApaG [Lewinellaceae bacterium]|nr:Co2+/Mg2+ efflux protein ApaG [Lewinellaceae bacterium]